jgi:hypothetical protein
MELDPGLRSWLYARQSAPTPTAALRISSHARSGPDVNLLLDDLLHNFKELTPFRIFPSEPAKPE